MTVKANQEERDFLAGLSMPITDDQKRLRRDQSKALREAGLRNTGGEKETAPKRVRKYTKKEVQAALAGVLTAGNIGLSLFPYFQHEPGKNDLLKEPETILLSGAIADELELHQEWLQWFYKLMENTTHAKLVSVVMILALPRLANHNVLPPMLANIMAAGMMDSLNNATNNETTTPPVSGEGIGAYSDSGGYGFGQVNPSGENPFTAPVSGSAEKQTRRGTVSSNGRAKRGADGQPAHESVGTFSEV